MDSEALVIESLDSVFFVDIIAKYLQISQDRFIYKSSKLTSATGKFDNFISDVYRLKIEYEYPATNQQSIEVILKSSFDLVSEIRQLSLFAREQLMYEDMIVDFERIWKESGNKIIKFGPACIKVTEKPCDIIVLEDLKTKNYQMMNKQDGINLKQTKNVLSHLAKFHAASAVRFLKDNKTMSHIFDRVANHIKHPPDSPIVGSLKTLFNKLLQVTNNLNIPAECTEKLSQFQLADLMDSYFDVTHPMKSDLTVLNHGDLWINNIMFKQDSNDNSIDVKFLDYQICFWGNPNADLIYLLFSSVSDDVKIECFEEITVFYYEELRNSLKQLQYEGHIPSVKELKEDLMSNRMYAIQLFLHIIPITRNCSSSTLEIKDLFSGSLTDEKLNLIFMDENFLKVLSSWLPFMNDKGFLDV